MIDTARQTYRVDIVRAIALLTGEHLQQMAAALAAGPQRRDQLVDEVKRRHREARRHLDNVRLTAFTLIIIHARAEALGDAALPAIRAIEEFVEQWQHAAGEDA